jgi:hypothetical protein
MSSLSSGTYWNFHSISKWAAHVSSVTPPPTRMFVDSLREGQHVSTGVPKATSQSFLTPQRGFPNANRGHPKEY